MCSVVVLSCMYSGSHKWHSLGSVEPPGCNASVTPMNAVCTAFATLLHCYDTLGALCKPPHSCNSSLPYQAITSAETVFHGLCHDFPGSDPSHLMSYCLLICIAVSHPLSVSYPQSVHSFLALWQYIYTSRPAVSALSHTVLPNRNFTHSPATMSGDRAHSETPVIISGTVSHVSHWCL